MRVLVASRHHNRGHALFGHAHELVRIGGGKHGINGDLDVTIRAVLEANRHGKSRGQVAVHLALGRARPDGTPRHSISDELRGDGIEELAAGREAQRHHIQQELARHGQPFVDREASVQVGVVDQALPANRGPRLLEVDPHHDAQVIFQFLRQWRQLFGITASSVRIVNRARPDHDHQAIIEPAQDAADLAARALDELCALGR